MSDRPEHYDYDRRNADLRQWQERLIRVETKQEIDIADLAGIKRDIKEEFAKVYQELSASNSKTDSILQIVTDIQIGMAKAKGKYSVVVGVAGTIGGACLMILANLFGWV